PTLFRSAPVGASHQALAAARRLHHHAADLSRLGAAGHRDRGGAARHAGDGDRRAPAAEGDGSRGGGARLARRRPGDFLAAYLSGNRATRNWTAVPADWLGLRLLWEFSHAAGAVLDLAALHLPDPGQPSHASS